MSGRKVAVVATYHRSWNYGACLQAFATRVILEKMGFEVLFANHSNLVEKPKSTFDYLKQGDFRGALATGVKNGVFGCRKYAKRAFEGFQLRLKSTDQLVVTSDDLLNLEADILIAGSDQIWNPSITGGELDRVFLLDCDTDIPKVSLASSAGNAEFSAVDRMALQSALGQYRAVSVREDALADQIESILGERPFKFLDPTLMLSSSDWASYESKPDSVEEDRYILAFTLKANSAEDSRFWQIASENLGLPVWRLTNNGFRAEGVDRQLLGMKPEEFLWMLRHASFVVTDSFHGTAFSINFERPFVTLPSKVGNNARMIDLLQSSGLAERFAPGYKFLPEFKDCSFEHACNYLKGKRIDCWRWLERAVCYE